MRNLEFIIHIINPISFVNQWSNNKDKTKGFLIWLLWFWKTSYRNRWTNYGVRLIGIEICIRKYL